MITTITRDELHAKLGQVTLIEALPAAHFEAEHLPTAVNAPELPTAETATKLIPELTSPVVVYCSGFGCPRSRAAAITLQRLGYVDIAVYEGGKADWQEAGLPMEGTRYAA